MHRIILAITSLAACTVALAKTPLDAETMWRLQRIGAPSVSPDGTRVVAPVTRYDLKENKARTLLWLFPLDRGEARALTAEGSDAASPVYSPDGRWIAFTSKRDGDDVAQLYVLPMAGGGEARRLTTVPTGVGGIRWFADSRRIAFVSRVWADRDWKAAAEELKRRKDSKVSATAWDKAPIRYWDQWIDDRQAHVFAIGLDGGEPQALTLAAGRELPRSEAGTASYDLSPDGRRIAYVSNTTRNEVDANPDVWLLEIGANEARNLTADNPGNDLAPQFSPDGKRIAFARQTIRGFYGDTRRLVVHDLAAGTNRVVGAGWDRSVDAPRWKADGRAMIAAVDDAGTSRLYEIPLDGGKPRAITGETDFGSIDLGRDGTLVALNQSFVSPPRLVRVDVRSGRASVLDRINDAVLDGIDWGSYESVTYAGARGEPVQMWVNYPPGFDRTQRHPLFVLLHGGPHNGITNAFAWRWNAQVFSAWGYVTAWPNFHGSSGFGQAFTDSINPDQDVLPYEDVIKATAMLAARPYIDPQRMVAGGGSYGGYLTAIVLGRDHPFKALVAHAAVYNWYSQVASDYGASKVRDGREFWNAPDLYQRSSPHFGAAHFDTPTLVIHGAQDFRVPVNQGIELFNALQNRGVESRLIHFPDENHWVLKPANSLYWYGEVRRWIDRHTIPASP
ncbi:MAG: S9 family peptidase [Xanthomonadales bacterium]|nr:S9 family peptidase [Xanthomonadales bacterium]